MRGEWDNVSNDADAAWLIERLASVRKEDRKLTKGTHLMHLETGRFALFDAVADFLSEGKTR